MAKNPKAAAVIDQFTEEPPWPTTMRSRLTDGRMVGTDNSVWVYREIPLSPVVDAASPGDALAAAEPLMNALDELAAMAAGGSVQRRSVAKSAYREFHLLLVNVPQVYQPPRNHPIAPYLRKSFGRIAVDNRVLLLGVKLQANVGGEGGFRAALDSVVETLTSGGTPLSDFDKDFKKVDAALTRAGLAPASAESIHTANAWWNQGRNADTPLLVHDDHLHFFSTVDAVRMADKAGVENCRTWDETGIPGQNAVTFACVEDLDLPFINPEEDSTATWVSDLLDAQALAVSIRGQIEPAKVTRAELRRQKKRYIDDINERAQNNKMQRGEQEEMLTRLSGVENFYATGGTPTLAGCSIVVALDGQVEDLSQALWQNSPVRLASMLFRQPAAHAEMMLCSNVRSNPNLHDLPSQSVAYSGLPSLSFVGDRDRNGDGEGAQLGFTQRDRQPAFLSPTAASNLDGLPLLLCAGSTGSGKTMVLLNLADQYSRMGNPTIIIDPKMGSDHSATVLAAGGQVASLDDLTQSDGVFDPIRFSATKEVGVELASSMLMSINPWGTHKEDMEVPLQHALSYGVSNGAECIGQALRIAERDLDLPVGMVDSVFKMTDSSPMFRACVGVDPNTQGLRAAKGITLIKVGNSHLDLPEPDSDSKSHTISQRIAMALVRMMVFGSAMALTDRKGVVMLDEAWVFLGAGSTEVQRLGRLARSQGVLPMLFTQRVTDAIDANLEGFISRGLILPIEDRVEALAACRLFKLEPTAQRMAAITAKGTISGSNANSVAPNWSSMRALRDPRTDKVIRGSIAIYADIHGRAIPVEIALSPEFLAIASTNPEDIARRLAEQTRRLPS